MKQLDLLLKNPMFKNNFNIIVSFIFIPVFRYTSKFFKQEVLYIDQEIKRAYQTIVFYPEVYIDYLIFSEDKRFFIHHGVDFFGICRACINIAFFNRVQGASTIEQQMIRTILKDYRISIIRKFKEQMLATYISNKYSKKEIAIIYLNIAYVGNFDKKLPLKDIDDHASSFVAAIRYPIHGKFNLKWSRKYNVRKKLILNGVLKK